VFLALLAAAALAVFGCQSRLQAKPVETVATIAKPMVIAHRGASGYRPEHIVISNTTDCTKYPRLNK